MAPPLKRKKQQQPTITEHALPQLKKPMEAVGKQVEFPGSFWGGRMSPEELRTLYKCTVRDFSLAHKFPGQLAPGPGFELQEMGAAGNGSTEHGDASGEIFWVPMDVFTTTRRSRTRCPSRRERILRLRQLRRRRSSTPARTASPRQTR